MYRVNPRLARYPDHFRNGQVGFNRPKRFGNMVAATDQIGFIGLEAMQAKLILLSVDRDRLNAQLRRSTENPNCDFPAISDHKTFDARSRARKGVHKNPFGNAYESTVAEDSIKIETKKQMKRDNLHTRKFQPLQAAT